MGRIFKFDKDVDTDQIIASQYLLFPTIDEMKSHTFESLDSDFASAVKPGDFVVADDNFGCGSSREQAPSVLKALGVKAVIAKSFARIFYRNAINIGLPVIVCKELHDEVNAGDECELSLEDGIKICKGIKKWQKCKSEYNGNNNPPVVLANDYAINWKDYSSFTEPHGQFKVLVTQIL